MNELKQILHVEDDPSIQTVTRVALETLGGYQVLSCASGREALERVKSFVPDLILLDVMMPEMDGIQTLLRLRERPGLRNTPVAFMTAKVQPGELDRLRALGACEVIVKPFDPMLLAARLRAAWDARAS